MATLTRQQASALLADGVQLDLHDAGAVHALLERQFDAAVCHRSAELSTLAEQLEPLLESMEARRKGRVSLVRALLGPQGTMAAYCATLQAAPRAALEASWGELERIVRDCKHATLRNGSLLAEQHSVMQRVLHGEEQIYAPR